MVDVISKVDQLGRMAELYFDANQRAASMQMHINYNRQANMRAVFPKFRYSMIELFYLVRFYDAVKNDTKFIKAMNKWLNKDLQKGVSVKFCIYSLFLFSKFVEKLVQIGVVEK
jgi:hypothetical protein